jgi:hypothetical protein
MYWQNDQESQLAFNGSLVFRLGVFANYPSTCAANDPTGANGQ